MKARYARPAGSGVSNANLRLAVGECLEALQQGPDTRRATVFLDWRTTVKLTRQRMPTKRDRSETLVLTLGRPNYREREQLKKGLPLGVQLQPWPRKR